MFGTRCNVPYSSGAIVVHGKDGAIDRRQKIPKFSLSQSELSDVRNLLAEAQSEICREVDPIGPKSTDPDDDKILACASTSGADYLVAGDEHLLVITQYGGTKILAPRDFESLFLD